VVGDDAQSIYSFRGADIKNILGFQTTSGRARRQARAELPLDQTILSAASAVIANNRGQISKELWTDVGEGDPIKVRELDDEHAEARYVAAEIERLGRRGVSRTEIAVFYRTNSQSRVLEDMLVRAQIGYQVIGGTKFYERAEIRDAIAYLTLLGNPQDVGAFTRIANSPRRGLARRRSLRVLSHADTMGIPCGTPPPARIGTRPGDRGAEGARALHVDHGAAAGARAGRGAGRRPAAGGAERDGLPGGARGERTIEAQGRIENLEEFVRVARSTTRRRRGEARSACSCSRSLCWRTPTRARTTRARDADDPATTRRARVSDRLHHRPRGRRVPALTRARRGRLEEERRLAYVGITRAMRDLTLTYARRRNSFGGAQSVGVRSRFIDEIPRELTDQPERERIGLPTGRIASWAGAAAASAEASVGAAAATPPARSSGPGRTSSMPPSGRAS
jgi:DNA helicase-2/ATP-dependent DNA helicase PcrA